ncbi:MAG: phosphoglycerate kinase [Candidatus Komeilibacteria bacterium]|nr:phosphoglycerate kinase [Candidatus Komeilibacteria bacterium]
MKTVALLKQLNGSRVIVSVDYNVPMANGKVLDPTKIVASLPTLQHLLKERATILLISHLGRPQGRRQSRFSLKPIVPVLTKLLGQQVVYWDGKILTRQALPKAKVILLENIRFWPGEENNNSALAKKLAALGDYYVNEAFANCHREHASMVGIPKYLPAFAGLDLAKEVTVLSEVLTSRLKPKIAVIGGAKISTKIELIKTLARTMDYILVGGALANNFLKAKGLPIGASIIEKSEVSTAKKLWNKKIILPIDALVATWPKAKEAESKIISSVTKQEMILDLGPETVKLFQGFIKKARLILWNGPMGYLENPLFRQGDGGIIAALRVSKAKKIVGGGETELALNYFKAQKVPTFCSTGGGAMLEFLAARGQLKSLKFFN